MSLTFRNQLKFWNKLYFCITFSPSDQTAWDLYTFYEDYVWKNVAT